ncbi:UNVERIFIED_CONTAM: mitochondrial ribosomal small subunit component [Siphonaria sp. JEL0065]|nr:mitochondrial ribosomal small subunit component [Siphonaria sp. JEL0065]
MHPTQVVLRSAWKGPFLTPLPPAPKDITQGVQTMARASTILPSHVGRKFLVHNGKDYLPVMVSEQMVNRKLGEFAPTRKPFVYKKSDKK